MKKKSRLFSWAGVSGLLLAAFASAPAIAGGYGDGGVPLGTTLYSGRATVIAVNATVLTSTHKVVIADTGELGADGATRDATVGTSDNPQPLEIHSRLLHAITSGANGTAASTAAVEKLVVNLSNSLVITADVVEADTQAVCHGDSMTVSTSGSSTIANLVINGHAINVTGQPNQTITLPGLVTIIINEQSNPDVNTMMVNAIHVKVPGVKGVASADVVISHAESGILTCNCD